MKISEKYCESIEIVMCNVRKSTQAMLLTNISLTEIKQKQRKSLFTYLQSSVADNPYANILFTTSHFEIKPYYINRDNLLQMLPNPMIVFISTRQLVNQK